MDQVEINELPAAHPHGGGGLITQADEGQAALKSAMAAEGLAALISFAPMDLDELESDLLTLTENPTQIPIIHHFMPGIYMREARLLAGCVLLGHKQAFPQSNIMLSGRVTMDSGTTLTAPMAFTGPAGRKCGVIHEDVAWLNIYPTDEQDIGKLEASFLVKTPVALAQEDATANEVTDAVLAARADFEVMLHDLSVTRELVSTMSAFTEDRIPLPWGAYRFRTARSPIAGEGVFASAPISAGETIGPANVRGCRTVLGYGMNHSGEPNARLVIRGEDLVVVATRDIQGNSSGRFGDEITVDYRESRKVASCHPLS